MRNYKHYNRYVKESKGYAVVMLIVIALLVAMFALMACGMFEEPLWKPDVQIPMTNANVSWSQSFHGGVFR